MKSQAGKWVGGKQYIHSSELGQLAPNAREAVDVAIRKLNGRELSSFNVVRIDAALEEVALLSYPSLGEVPFPSLSSSWRIHLPTSLVTYRDYSSSLNPPVLHRTELLLPEGHRARQACAALTEQCEQIGLFDNPTAIGFQKQWRDLIQQKGYELQGFDLLPIANVSDFRPEESSDGSFDASTRIARHLTALSRRNLSAPVQSLLRDGLLSVDRTFFDYGCGKGDDLRTLRASGFRAEGWDPHYLPDAQRSAADVVNIGFVINVIEDREERMAALEGAFRLTKGVLAVGAMIASTAVTGGATYRDGVRTGRNTFQKYFTQSELQQFIESVLGEDAYSVGPGIFYVFRDRGIEQSYLLDRTSDRSRVARASLPILRFEPAPRSPREAPQRTLISPEGIACLDQLWDLCLRLGRAPDLDELSALPDLTVHFRSPKRAIAACLARHDQASLEKAGRGRRDDILVMLALHFFGRRRRFGELEPRLQHDVRSFFGSFQLAESQARQLLFSISVPEIIRNACETAAALGLGWLDPSVSLQLHTAFVQRLPAVLRVYVGCATALAGDLAVYDLVKIHIQSGKVTLMAFDDFVNKPVPALLSRVKVRLRDQAFDLFTYGDAYPPTVLYEKSRYINEEFPHYAEQVAFDEALRALNVVDLSAHGLPEGEFAKALSRVRYKLKGFQLARSDDIPGLDESCGANYRYRDLIECGETWQRTRAGNAPRSAETYNALCDLARYVLDPIIEYFGSIQLTYGFASSALAKHIVGSIAPALDQHASCERGSAGRPISDRGGAAVDFLIEYEDMYAVSEWIAVNTPFDRLYFYGADRPIHVSYGPQHSRQIVDLLATARGKSIPRVRRPDPAQRATRSSDVPDELAN